jgi:hypothetical protein
MNRSDFQRLARVRLRESKLLLAANAPDGAYYLAGYAVECALKACIAKRTQRHDFPEKQSVLDSHSHDFKKLLERAGLKAIHDSAMDQPQFANYWKTVAEWKPVSRYENHSKQMAEELINAIAN